MTDKQRNNLVLLLQIAAVSVFLGRAWQHLFWDAPFRTLLWDEGWMKGIVEGGMGMSWDTYITSLEVDDNIQGLIKGTGIFYLICALIAGFIRQVPKWVARILWLGALSLTFLAALYCKEKFFSVGQFFEYSLQVGSPLFLYAMVYKSIYLERLLLLMKIAIALTFVCHGLYAVNFYPRPGIFVDMFLNTLGTSEETAHSLLFVAGLLDFIISLLIFLPYKCARPAMAYAVFWGLATALARVTSFFDFSYAGESLYQWLHETVYRMPHFLIPLVAFILMGYLMEESKLESKSKSKYLR